MCFVHDLLNEISNFLILNTNRNFIGLTNLVGNFKIIYDCF